MSFLSFPENEKGQLEASIIEDLIFGRLCLSRQLGHCTWVINRISEDALVGFESKSSGESKDYSTAALTAHSLRITNIFLDSVALL